MSHSLALAFVTQKAMCYAHVSAEIGKFKTGTVRKNLLYSFNLVWLKQMELSVSFRLDWISILIYSSQVWALAYMYMKCVFVQRYNNLAFL